jgi:hypothetical protein
MNPRRDIITFDDIPNVGPATIRYLRILGINTPFELIGQNPRALYHQLCKETGKRFDPCLADVFIAAVKFMEGEPPQKWWYYTKERKTILQTRHTQKLQPTPLNAGDKVKAQGGAAEL